jgi:molecular chaperone DnaJ
MPTNVKIDYYEVLAVSRDCSAQELKTSYRKIAMEFHPDRNPDNPAAEETFKAASEAYQVLSDPDKRSAYDRFGHAGVSGGGPQGNPFGGDVDLGDIFGDIFGEMFNMGGGGSRRASRVQRGRDLQFDMALEFEEAVFGKEQEITLRRQEACVECKGSGAAKGKQHPRQGPRRRRRRHPHPLPGRRRRRTLRRPRGRPLHRAFGEVAQVP